MKEKIGYTWIEIENGGFWKKVKNENGNKHRLPIFCPNEECRRLTGTVDDRFLTEYGICYTCYTLYVDERQTPAIDLDKYRPVRSNS